MKIILTQGLHRITQKVGCTLFALSLRPLWYISAGLFYFFVSCIEPFEPVNVQDTAGILVVEGMILEKGTTIKLSRTIRLDSSLRNTSKYDAIHDAHVYVIDESNNVVAVAEPQIVDNKINPGVYIVKGDIIFKPGTKFALDIQIVDRHYQSAFVSPVLTPEIDEVSWKINDDMSLDIMVSTHDPKGEVRYFRWAFEEDWEIHSFYFGEAIFDTYSKTLTDQDLFGPNNKFYCWDSDVSKSILVGMSEKNTEAIIKNKRIHRIMPYDTRFSYLYSILVRQYGIDKEAYKYFDNLQKNIDPGNIFFAPQPTEIKGNIKCISDPDEPVIGYIVATKEVVSRLFIDMQKSEVEELHNCEEQYIYGLSDLTAAYLGGLGISAVDINEGTFVCVNIRCVDCTLRGGTKNKPDFWPNNHQ